MGMRMNLFYAVFCYLRFSPCAALGLLYLLLFHPLCRTAFFTPSVALGRFAARHLPQTVRYALWGRLLTASENLSLHE
jgi:hypothetical protein